MLRRERGLRTSDGSMQRRAGVAADFHTSSTAHAVVPRPEPKSSTLSGTNDGTRVLSSDSTCGGAHARKPRHRTWPSCGGRVGSRAAAGCATGAGGAGAWQGSGPPGTNLAPLMQCRSSARLGTTLAPGMGCGLARGCSDGGAAAAAHEKRVVIFSGWVFFLISLGGQTPHVRPVGRTFSEPNKLELNPIGVELNGP